MNLSLTDSACEAIYSYIYSKEGFLELFFLFHPRCFSSFIVIIQAKLFFFATPSKMKPLGALHPSRVVACDYAHMFGPDISNTHIRSFSIVKGQPKAANNKNSFS